MAPGDDSLRGKQLDNRFSDASLLPHFKMGIHGQRENLGCKPLGHGEIPLFVAEACIGPLQMKRRRVVNLCGDPSIGKMPLELISVSDSNDVYVIYRLGP